MPGTRHYLTMAKNDDWSAMGVERTFVLLEVKPPSYGSLCCIGTCQLYQVAGISRSVPAWLSQVGGPGARN